MSKLLMTSGLIASVASMPAPVLAEDTTKAVAFGKAALTDPYNYDAATEPEAWATYGAMPTADPGTQQPYPADYGYYGQEAFAQPQGKTYTYPAPTYPAAAAGFKDQSDWYRAYKDQIANIATSIGSGYEPPVYPATLPTAGTPPYSPYDPAGSAFPRATAAYGAAYPNAGYAYPRNPYATAGPEVTPLSKKKTGMEALLPLIMMMEGGGGEDMESLLPLMMMSGGMDTKTGGKGGMEALLPLLMMSGGMGSGGGGMSSMLPLMMMNGGMGGGGSMDSLLPLLLMSGEKGNAEADRHAETKSAPTEAGQNVTDTDADVTENRSAKTGGNSDLLKILMLSQMSQQSGEGMQPSQLLPLMMMSGGMGGSGGGMGELLPLMMQMQQAQQGTTQASPNGYGSYFGGM